MSATTVAALAVATPHFLRRHCTLLDVTGSSMLPTYREGDRLLAVKVPARLVRRGSAVAIRMRAAPDLDTADGFPPGILVPTCLIKRVAALPGDRVPGPSSAPGVVPARHVFVLGDNPEASYDSRHTGPVPFDLLTAVVLCRVRQGAGARTAAISAR
ncbi:S26 family signal peptidase [Streptomyces sp. NPDC002889]|uniref:S26 family signal peptidase n=1 Tax=Streptomyces sp. NPDC002889 TaxID=3364669 RepID=UPI0036B26C38